MMTRSNAVLAGISVILALFLWIYVRLVFGGTEISRVMEVPIILKGTPPAGFDIQLHPDSTNARVRLQGPANTINSILRQEVQANVDVAHVSTEKPTVQAPVQIDVPATVKVLSQPKATLRVLRLVQKSMPVTVAFITTPPAGTTVGSYLLEPGTVTLEAQSEGDLDAVKYVSVPVDPNVALKASRKLEPRAISEDGKLVENVRVLGPPIEVRMTSLTGQPVTRRVAVRPPSLLHVSSRYIVTVKVRPDEVTVSGSADAVARQPAYLETESLEAGSLRRDETRTVHLKVPEDLRVVEGNDVRVDIKVDVRR